MRLTLKSTDTGDAACTNCVNKPQDATIWTYWNSENERWIESNETEVYAGNNT